ncbi:MAG: rod shape-determining protein RodA [Rectinemataceae bacterium]
MRSLKLLLEEIDLPLLGATVALVVIGIFSIYSSGVTANGIVVSNEYIKQIVWAALGIVLMVFVAFLDHNRMKDYSFFVYLFFLFALLYTNIGGKVVNGARSWLGIGDFGIQPSEFMKLATILFLAQYLAGSEHQSSLRRFAVSFLIILIPIALILPQGDFGTALVFFPILLFMVFIAGLERRQVLFVLAVSAFSSIFTILPLWERFILKSPSAFLFIFYRAPYSYFILGASALIYALAIWGWVSFKRRYYYWIAFVSLIFAASILFSTVAHHVLREYQVMRLIVFIDPSIDPRGSGWNILQSMTAIGSGGFAGKGFLQGTQSHYRYLPQQSTDFIFSIIAEEWGFLGGFAVFALFFVILRRCILLLKTVKDNYANYVVAGVMGMVFFHFMINSGMVMGIMPITGIPLFFLSYGGSSLWTVLLSIGLLLGISARRYRV